jgi:thiamine pyrophosphate-dependent acetolactate synthase large subunit-like protein
MNLVTGVAHAYADSAPIIALGGASPISQFHSEVFQEIDQLSIMRPATKWAAQAVSARRIPEYINMAYRQALTGRLGPAYLDLPGDVLYARVDEEMVVWPQPAKTAHRIPGDPGLVKEAVDLLSRADRPLMVTGSGILWSNASETSNVDATGIPFMTTLKAGCDSDDHPRSFLAARNMAFQNSDVMLFLGTRFNYVISHGQPPALIQMPKSPGERGSGGNW